MTQLNSSLKDGHCTNPAALDSKLPFPSITLHEPYFSSFCGRTWTKGEKEKEEGRGANIYGNYRSTGGRV